MRSIPIPQAQKKIHKKRKNRGRRQSIQVQDEIIFSAWNHAFSVLFHTFCFAKKKSKRKKSKKNFCKIICFVRYVISYVYTIYGF